MTQQQQTKNNAGNFMNYFNSKVLPVTVNIENYRSKIFIGIIIWAVIVAALPVLFSLIILFAKGTLIDKIIAIVTFLIPTAIVICIPVFFIKKIYSLFAKEKVIPALLGYWGAYIYVPPLNLISAIYKTIKNKTGFGGLWAELRKDKKTNISVNPTILARLFRFDSIDYDDKIVGKYKDVEIEFAELSTSYTTTRSGSDGKQSRQKIYTFKGVVFSAKMNKKFKGITAVSHDNVDKRRMLQPVVGAKQISSMSLTDVITFGSQIAATAGAVKKMVNDRTKTIEELKKQGKTDEEIQSIIASKYPNQEPPSVVNQQLPQKLEDVFLEDPLFNRKFKMCSTDQVEARYIFTTAFLNRFMKIAESFNYRLHAIFIDDNVYILIDAGSFLNKKDWFEVPFFKSCKDPKNYQEFLNDFTRLLAIAETLKLNQHIGM